MASPSNVIIFGATGSVGSAAALKAYQEGAKVTLAMRDTLKSIPTLGDISAEKVQADLTKPETVQTAVRQSGAKTAFVYAIQGIPDDMRHTFVALKKGGIEFVVLLSSFLVQGDRHATPPTEIVPYVHAKVEIALESVFGNRCSAVRPAYFASNVLHFKDEIAHGEVKLPNPDAEFDWISPKDIGQVIGMALAHGTQEISIPLVGPNRLSVRDTLSIISRVLSKEIKITVVGKKQAVEDIQQRGLPEPAAKWFVEAVTGQRSFIWDVPDFEVGVDNVRKYTHQSPERFEQWLEENKEKFTV
ncbi:hypothetical protein N7537_000853 [Penicillium hordei]|jgi:NmrA-like family.|uniref:NmrA-like domain-containing protein n=1 Tax=Penicillium hordei TaxID=40994 RepID=A0AAD6EEF6_9EURO|nr:uncharacterized protein N7537_000853 [Penicillium hordei]KAJ5615739.1 hypothetical protein N7537_000853 [Penicillium hordei]